MQSMLANPPVLTKASAGSVRTAEQIIASIKDHTLREAAKSYFGCFRFQKMGNKGYQPCDHCRLNQLHILHCHDSQEEDCLCVDCANFKRMDNGGCEDYPEEEDDDFYDHDDAH